jgi:hypothetical protein
MIRISAVGAVAVVALAACDRQTTTAAIAATPASIAGTYSLQMCRGVCRARNDSNTLAVGRLVLFDTPVDSARLAAFLAPLQPESHRRFLYLVDDRDRAAPNACFVFDSVRQRPLSYGTIRRGGFMRASNVNERLVFPLYHSADAFFEAAVRVREDGYVGSGRSAGVELAKVGYPDETLIGWRIGAADSTVCQAGILAGLRQFDQWKRAQGIPDR